MIRSVRCLSIPALLVLSLAAAPAARAATVTVPGDFATVQAAVDAVQNDADPGEVVVESEGPFEEAVTITESVTIRAGAGVTPVIQRLTGFNTPIRINASADAATTVVLRGLLVRASNAGGGPGLAILVQNASATELLTVQVDQTRVEVPVGDQGIRASSGAGEIWLEVTNSSFEAIGDGSGAPACIMVDPTAAPLTLVATGNHLRFSRAAGIIVDPGVDAPVFATVERNLFEGFESETGSGRTGLDVSGPNAPGNIHAEVAATNNVFLRTAVALDVNGQAQNDLDVFFANNTAVGGTDGLVFAVSFSEASVQLDLFNNVLAGSDAAAIFASDNGGTLTVNADHQLFFDNFADYDGVPAGPNDVQADPLFVDAASDDYRLAAASPAIDAGNSTPPGGTLPATDFDGNVRVIDGDGDGSAVVDIGAFEAPEPAGLASALAAIGALGAVRRLRLRW